MAATTLLTMLLYDDRYNETRDRLSPLFRSFDAEGIPFRVGLPLNAAERTSGAPGDAHSGKANYSPAHKVEWLLRTLPGLIGQTELVFLADTDTMWFCGAAEVARKRAELMARQNQSNAVVISAESGLWPPWQEYRGAALDGGASAAPGPRALPSGPAPFRYLNAGAALGRPADVLALLTCMRDR